jgi:hypothetical protein
MTSGDKIVGIISVVLGLTAAWLICPEVFAAHGLLDRWQTLVAGGLALLAALHGASLLHRQIQQADLHEADRLSRRALAVRSAAPLVLSSLVEWSVASARALIALVPHNADHMDAVDASRFEAAEFPDGLVSDLRELVETQPPNVQTAVADLLSAIQVHRARVLGLVSDQRATGRHPIHVTDLERYTVDAAEIYARGSHLFEWARREVEATPTGPIAAREVRTALNIMQVYQPMYERLHAYVLRAYP